MKTKEGIKEKKMFLGFCYFIFYVTRKEKEETENENRKRENEKSKNKTELLLS